jgi:hypothetical protein
VKIIGLTGRAGAGKDTFAGYAIEWCEQQGLTAQRLAFADSLKVSAARALGFQGVSKLGSPAEVAECVAFCNDIKNSTEVTVARYIPGSTGPEPEPPDWEILTKITGREFLQFYGTEAHRDVFGKEFWNEQTQEKLEELISGHEVDVVFLTDLRFENEAEMIHRLGGEVWEVLRPEAEATADMHASEAGLTPEQIDFRVYNTGTFMEFKASVRAICEGKLA